MTDSENKDNFCPHILLVDDDASLIQVMAQMGRKWGYLITTSSNGEDGIQKARATKFDLLVLDVMMPGMDGWTFIQKFRTLPGCAHIPVIFLTALKSPKERVKSFQLGANDYLQKPFYFDELKVRIDNLLKTPDSSHSAALKGTLKQLGLPSLLMGLEMEQKSGTLVVDNQITNEKACIFLRDGHIVRARLTNKTRPKNDELIYTLLNWPDDAKFEFKAMAIDIEPEIDSSVTSLLLEAARRIDEANKATILINQETLDNTNYDKELTMKKEGKILVHIPSDFRDFMPEVLARLKRDVETMLKSLEKGEYEVLQRIGHSIKGTCPTYGMDATYAIGQTIEQSAKAKNPDGIRQGVKSLSEYLTRLEIVYD